MKLSVSIAGTSVNDIGLMEGLEIRRQSREAISEASVTFQQRLNAGDRFAARTWTEQTEILIHEAGAPANIHFAGFVQALERSPNDNEKFRVQVGAIDFGSILDRKIITQTWTSATDRQIAKDIAAVASAAGITATDATVAFTATLATFEAKDVTLREALDQLCEATGARWHVDGAKVLQYYRPGLRFAPFSLSDTPDGVTSFGFQMASFRREFTAAANRLTLLGGLGEAGAELRVTREHAASIAAYGVLEAVKVDRNITSTAIAQLTADAELETRAQPRVSGRAIVRRPGLELGQMIGVKSALYGVDASYLITGMRESLEAGQVVWEIEFGTQEGNLVSALRRLARSSTSIPRAIPAPNSVESLAADRITGVIQDSQLAGIAAEKLIGLIQGFQISAIAAGQITGLLGAHQIGTVAAESVTGALVAEQINTVNAVSIQGVIVGAQLTDQIMDSLRLVGSEMQIIERVNSLPALPNTGYPVGSLVLISSVFGRPRYGQAKYGSVLYENKAGAWIRSSASASLTGTLRARDIENITAEQITGLILAHQIQNINAGQIAGMIQANQILAVNANAIAAVNASAIPVLTADKIGAVNAAAVIGMLQAYQIAAVNANAIAAVNASAIPVLTADKIGALNADTVTLVGLWKDGQIQSISASKLLAGTVTATVRMTSPDIEVTGSGYNLRLKSTTGFEVTATATSRKLTLTDAGITIDGLPGYYTKFTDTEVLVRHGAGHQVQLISASNTSTLNVVTGAAVGWSMWAGTSHSLQSSATAPQILMNGADASIRMGGANSYIYVAGQYRAPITTSSPITMPATYSKYMNVYDVNGTLAGKIPII